ncbi:MULTISPECIES: alpha/beta fold hydrolase [unclassified Streptomyces]|uniref:alpha/beta fold hydrolase n=1 Tax=unclassified Streptomyces TaxID=2593676 RepID=UPI002256D28D|nr:MULTISPECIES: alpha/beta hydrolase [unclassified Streptomyces]MCX4410208.1 alpha/beta hydrolase [Streptomyces sp. NBC_01764]MCX5191984.1 alpha/beta hydrolase [Streptomyces sp. NBC_00268]
MNTTAANTAATRAELVIDGRRLSYLDFGGTGRPIVALHGHLSEGASFAPLAQVLGADWRLIAPDQRGHGESDRAADYSREGYLADIEALLDHLGLDHVVLLGHSLGAINAYQFAARHPERVTALVNVEGAASLGLEGPNPFAFLLNQPYQAPSREALLAGLGPAAPYFAGRLRENADGTWRLPFHPQDMYRSEDLVHGDHWEDWTATDCPALLIHGTKGIIPAEQIRAMVEHRPGTAPVELDADHLIPTTAPDAFAAAVKAFLATI